jgi:hypothetical protein
MANFVLVRHNVRDFSEWKPVYDADRPNRIAAGLTDKQLLRGVADSNEVVLLFEAADLDRAKAFVDSPQLREAMQHGGVLGKPDLSFLEG